MSLDVFVSPELQRGLDPEVWFRAFERNVPRALAPVAHAMKGAAPKGKTGKLSRRFEVQAKRVNQGFIRGIEANIVTKVPYGHLVESGHKIIARGPTRKGRQLTRARRAEFRSALKERRAAGAIGFVPGRFFGQRTLESRREQVLALLGRLVIQEVAR